MWEYKPRSEKKKDGEINQAIEFELKQEFYREIKTSSSLYDSASSQILMLEE